MRRGYGTDISTYPGVGRKLLLVSERDNLAQALTRRLETPWGWLARFKDPTAPDYERWAEYGYDCRFLLEAKFTPAQTLAFQTEIKVELEKDDRITRVDVDLSPPTPSDARMTVVIRVLPKSGGPFKMIIDVTAAGITLAQIQPI